MKKTEELTEELTQTAPELQPDDGNSITAPELPTQEQNEQQPLNLGLPDFSTIPTNSNNYTPEEFRDKFAAVLEFLENPAAATDCVGELLANGRNLTADKIYSVAARHSWLGWIIDKRAQLFADGLQIAAFLAIESNLIVLNWTGINTFERLKIWVKDKAKARKQAAKEGKRRTLFGWAFSARPEVEKHTEQNN